MYQILLEELINGWQHAELSKHDLPSDKRVTGSLWSAVLGSAVKIIYLLTRFAF
jgi:hypothetical protein